MPELLGVKLGLKVEWYLEPESQLKFFLKACRLKTTLKVVSIKKRRKGR